MSKILKTWCNDVDTVAAADEADADLLLKEVYGYDDSDLEGNNWYVVYDLYQITKEQDRD